MRLRLRQWQAHLQAPLAPLYLIIGDELLLCQEALDALRQAARQQGYSEREVFHIERGLQPGQILQAARSPSLFGDRRLLELRCTQAPSQELAAILAELAADPDRDTLLVCSLPRLHARELKAAWIEAWERQGVMLDIDKVDAAALPAWLRERLAAAGFSASPEVIAVLVERTEGHLLAAAQEISKLQLLCPPGEIDLETLLASSSPAARYDVYAMSDAALAGQAERALDILHYLLEEGEALPLLLSALCSDLRHLLAAATAQARGEAPAPAMRAAGAWERRLPALQKALTRFTLGQLQGLLDLAHACDRSIKGRGELAAELGLLRLLCALAGRPLLRTTRPAARLTPANARTPA